MDDGVPTCILCFEPFDADEVVPRVLTCGHSLCESCIPNLVVMNPPACPTCKAPIRAGNVHMFPKNFELLPLLAPAPKNARPKPDPSIPPPPTPSLDFMFWSQELVSRWKKWIIPPQVVDDQSISMDSGKSLWKASIRVGVTTVCGTDVEPNQPVSLLPLRRTPSVSQGCGFRLSYMGRILDMLDRMEERGREELAAMLEAVSRQRRGLCRMYGLWMNSLGEDSVFYLVCESSHWDFSQSLDQDKRLHYGMVGMELCETVMALHFQGIVCGFLSPSCFFFDCHGHFLLDLNHVLHLGLELRYRIESSDNTEGYDPSSTCAFISPEVFRLLQGENNSSNSCSKVAHSSDVWSLACVFMLLMGNASLRTALFNLSSDTLLSVDSYNVWMDDLISKLQDSDVGECFDSLKEIIKTSLSYEPRHRPQVVDLWRCIRKLVFKHYTDHIRYTDVPAVMKSSIYCLLLFGHTSALKQTYNAPNHQKNRNESLSQDSDPLEKVTENVDMMEIIQKDSSQSQSEKINRIQNAEMQGNLIKSFTLEGHRDCVTGLAIGEGFLFSSSNDKTIRAWSLQDFSYSHTLVGHEHRITTIVVASKRKLCLSADFGGFICAWSIDCSSDQVPLKKWLEHSDWHFGKVNSLAVDDYRIFSCSGDKSINVWSLKDFKHLQKMEGHSSTVNSLAVANATLYSSSRDGTIRVWWLDDYTVMKVLGNEEQWYGLAALSLSVDDDLLVATYENGYIKIWRNHVAMKAVKIGNGAIFASQMIKKKWLFTGGWDKAIEIQRVPTNECQMDVETFGSIICHSAITSLLYWQGKLFVGFSNKDIKVYSLEKL